MKAIVTQRIDHIERYGEIRESLDQRLLEWLIKAGLLPIPISNKLVSMDDVKDKTSKKHLALDRWISNVRPNFLILSGGNDIGEYIERDETEKQLLDWAKKYHPSSRYL